MRLIIRNFQLLSLVSLCCLVGCGRPDGESSTSSPVDSPSADGSAYFVAEQPEGAMGVIDARSNVRDEEELVVIGRIGGSTDPWVEGRAAFSLVDLSLKSCNDTMDDHCATPWDYCCEATLPQSRVLVKFVDASQQVVATDARKLLGVKELQTVAIAGKAKRDESDNLTILAKSIFVVDSAK